MAEFGVFIHNTELNDFRKIICVRKSEVSVERISVSYVIENLSAMLCNQRRHRSDTIATVTSYWFHSVKVLSTLVGYSLVAMVTDLH